MPCRAARSCAWNSCRAEVLSSSAMLAQSCAANAGLAVDKDRSRSARPHSTYRCGLRAEILISEIIMKSRKRDQRCTTIFSPFAVGTFGRSALQSCPSWPWPAAKPRESASEYHSRNTSRRAPTSGRSPVVTICSVLLIQQCRRDTQQTERLECTRVTSEIVRNMREMTDLRIRRCERDRRWKDQADRRRRPCT